MHEATRPAALTADEWHVVQFMRDHGITRTEALRKLSGRLLTSPPDSPPLRILPALRPEGSPPGRRAGGSPRPC